MICTCVHEHVCAQLCRAFAVVLTQCFPFSWGTQYTMAMLCSWRSAGQRSLKHTHTHTHTHTHSLFGVYRECKLTCFVYHAPTYMWSATLQRACVTQGWAGDIEPHNSHFLRTLGRWISVEDTGTLYCCSTHWEDGQRLRMFLSRLTQTTHTCIGLISRLCVWNHLSVTFETQLCVDGAG